MGDDELEFDELELQITEDYLDELELAEQELISALEVSTRLLGTSKTADILVEWLTEQNDD